MACFESLSPKFRGWKFHLFFCALITSKWSNYSGGDPKWSKFTIHAGKNLPPYDPKWSKMIQFTATGWWLFEPTHLKNMRKSKMRSSFPGFGVKIKNDWDHHLDKHAWLWHPSFHHWKPVTFLSKNESTLPPQKTPSNCWSATEKKINHTRQ